VEIQATLRQINLKFVLLLAISAFYEEKDGFSTPPRQSKRSSLLPRGGQELTSWLQNLKIAWFVTGPPMAMAVAAAFTLRTHRNIPQ
jgi:hypothetical protein